MPSSSASSSGGISPGVMICGSRPTPGSVGAIGEHLGEPGDEVGQVVGVAAVGAALELERRRCRGGPARPGGGATARSRPPGTRRASARTSSMSRAGEVAEVARIEQRTQVRGHARERTPDFWEPRMPPISCAPCDAPSSPWPPRGARPSARRLRRIRRRRQRLHAGRLRAGGGRQGQPQVRRATATRPDAGCVEVTYTNEGSTGPQPAHRGQVAASS